MKIDFKIVTRKIYFLVALISALDIMVYIVVLCFSYASIGGLVANVFIFRQQGRWLE